MNLQILPKGTFLKIKGNSPSKSHWEMDNVKSLKCDCYVLVRFMKSLTYRNTRKLDFCLIVSFLTLWYFNVVKLRPESSNLSLRFNSVRRPFSAWGLMIQTQCIIQCIVIFMRWGDTTGDCMTLNKTTFAKHFLTSQKQKAFFCNKWQ